MVHEAGGVRRDYSRAEELNLRYPTVDAAKRKELKAARAALEHEGDHR